MSPRKNTNKRPRGKATPAPVERNIEEIGLSFSSTEEHADGVYEVRKITGSSSTKPYRCPGCDQMIPTATPHIVAWPEFDIESRRHWHTPCWKKKNHRAPRTERTRNAPRY